MVISSIDLKGGSVVQLKNGRTLLLERDDSESLIADFDKFGEVAVIDLDQALGNVNSFGETKNSKILKNLLRKGNVRVGGGIRSVQKAKELISLGAEKVIVGSAAWNKKFFLGEKSKNQKLSVASDVLNVEFLQNLTKAIGRQRIIISVDSIEGKIATHGWTKTIEVSLLEGARFAQEFASELLFTCVEKEGCMQGTDFEACKNLRQNVECRLVVAGGISSIQEIVRLEKLGCDVQLGAALYTGMVDLKSAFVECLNWEKCKNLIPVIAQSTSGQVLMTGFSNKEAILRSFESGNLTFFSRTRNAIWTKGETSGNFLRLKKMRADCDRDTILAIVEPQGPVCHMGGFSCFSCEAEAKSDLERLFSKIQNQNSAQNKKINQDKIEKISKIKEQILKTAKNFQNTSEKTQAISQMADLVYFISEFLFFEGATWQEIYNELDFRHKNSIFFENSENSE